MVQQYFLVAFKKIKRHLLVSVHLLVNL